MQLSTNLINKVMEIKKKPGQNITSLFYKINGDWDEQSKSLKTQYPKLSSEDLKFETGKETDLFKKLETKLGKNRDEVINILKTNQKKLL